MVWPATGGGGAAETTFDCARNGPAATVPSSKRKSNAAVFDGQQERGFLTRRFTGRFREHSRVGNPRSAADEPGVATRRNLRTRQLSRSPSRVECRLAAGDTQLAFCTVDIKLLPVKQVSGNTTVINRWSVGAGLVHLRDAAIAPLPAVSPSRVLVTRARTRTLALLAAGFVATATAGLAQTSFTNSTAISVNNLAGGTATADEYPSVIAVSGLSGTISKVTVRLRNINAPKECALDALLVGPTGAGLVLMADAAAHTCGGVTDTTLTFDDNGESLLLNADPVTGTYMPTSYHAAVGEALDFPAPGPGTALPGSFIPQPAGAGTLLYAFDGLDPNGPWSLYVVQDASGQGLEPSVIAGGWSLTITTDAATVRTNPVAKTDVFGTTQDQPLSVPVMTLLTNDTDPAGRVLSVTGVDSTSTNGAVVTLAGGSLTFTPVPHFIGADRFNYTVSNAQGGSATGAVIVVVSAPGMPLFNHLAVEPGVPRRFLFTGLPGGSYHIQSAGTVAGPYTNLSPVLVAEASGLVRYTETNAPPGAARFYRAASAP